jgi:hypothetical protein
MGINRDKISQGTASDDTIHDTYNNLYYFGLQGNDLLAASSLSYTGRIESSTFLAGGSGSDAYAWDGTGTVVIAETGGSADYYIDFSTWGDIDWIAEVGDHLVLWGAAGNAMVYANYKKPDARIEDFYLVNQDNTTRTHFTHDEFVSWVKQLPGWQGSISYEQFGFDSYHAANTEAYIAEVVQLAAEYESVPETRVADKSDVSVLGRLYQAAFDRTPDVGGLNYWVDQWEENMEPLEVASRFYDSAEFKARYGSPSDEGFIDLLYENVLDRDPDVGGLNYWLGELAGGMDRSEVLARFSESTENIANTEVTFNALHDTGDGYWMF